MYLFYLIFIFSQLLHLALLQLVSEVTDNACESNQVFLRVIFGKRIDIEDVPYQLSLFYQGDFTCGASIINNTHAISAAHCVDGRDHSQFAVRAGSKFISSGGVFVNIKSITMHPLYDSETIDYDITILEFKTPLVFSSKINAIALPSVNTEIKDNTLAFVSGWGLSLDLDSDYLQGANIPIVNQEVCKTLLGENSITPRMICAGCLTGLKDSCFGDSGGPLVIDGALIGIVSWGNLCGLPAQPGVYARVTALLPFIQGN